MKSADTKDGETQRSDSAQRPLWAPSKSRADASNLARYMKMAGDRVGREFKTYDDLYRWSVTDLEAFWETIWEWARVIHSRKYERVLSGHEMPGAKWFNGAKLNFAENLLRFRDHHPAIIHFSENGKPARLTYLDLYESVGACANGMRKLGVRPGDRIAAYVPNVPQAVIGMLAATSIGAIWSSCSPDFGLQGVLDRFGQIAPKVLITCDGYRYSGNEVNLSDRLRLIADRIPELEQVVIIPVIGCASSMDIRKAMSWEELLKAGADRITFEQLPFDHPVYIMYSSGTTGSPKCIVHGAGGTLLQHYKELSLHTDLKREDVISYYTTCGWMMWNWLVSSLAVGATIFIYDGNPFFPRADVLWRAVEQQEISILGTSPGYLSGCRRANVSPRKAFGLDSLRTVLSTGAPLSAENYAWIYEEVKQDVQLSSISGGTDIISCFMLGNPLLPVYSEEIQCRGLGMKVEAYDDCGRSVIEQTGDLVCTAPFPSMPVSFWNDPDGGKYLSAYFDEYPGVWRHGDFIRITDHGGVVVYGRSDATLKPGGVRIGTAEIYSPVESLDEVADSLAIGQSWQGDIRIVLFVVLKDGFSLTDELKAKIRGAIRDQASPRHVPQVILAIREVPRTLNGKKVEVAVRRIIHGQEIANRESLLNPESLNQFIDIPELRV